MDQRPRVPNKVGPIGRFVAVDSALQLFERYFRGRKRERAILHLDRDLRPKEIISTGASASSNVRYTLSRSAIAPFPSPRAQLAGFNRVAGEAGRQ